MLWQKASSSAAQLNWSVVGFFHNQRHSKSSINILERIVYVQIQGWWTKSVTATINEVNVDSDSDSLKHGGASDNWSYKSPVKSSPPTNQHPAFYTPDALPVAQPTSAQWRQKVSHSMDLLAQTSPGGLPT